MDLTKVIFGADSDNKKDGTHFSSSSLSAADSSSGSANSGGGNGGGGDNDEKNGGHEVADSHQHDGDRDLFASENGDHSKTLAVGGEIEQEKVTKGQVIQEEVDDHYFKAMAMAMAMDEIMDEILEQQNQLGDFIIREEERLISELLEAEIACKELKRELTLKNLELLKATAVSHALNLHSLKIKIQASNERTAQLESKFQVLKADYKKLRKNPPF